MDRWGAASDLRGALKRFDDGDVHGLFVLSLFSFCGAAFRTCAPREKVLGSNPTPVRALDVSRVNPGSAVIGSSSPAALTE